MNFFRLWEAVEIAKDVPAHPPVIFVDMDETLICRKYVDDPHWLPKSVASDYHLWSDDQRINYHAQMGDKYWIDSKNKYKSKYIKDEINRMRPHADEFLQQISTVGPLYVMSTAMTHRAKEILAMHGLAGFFKDIIGMEDFAKAPKNKDSILIDDISDDLAMSQKLQAAQINKDRIIKVPKYHGEVEDPTLLKIVPQVKKLFNTPGKEYEKWEPPQWGFHQYGGKHYGDMSPGFTDLLAKYQMRASNPDKTPPAKEIGMGGMYSPAKGETGPKPHTPPEPPKDHPMYNFWKKMHGGGS